MIYLNVKTLILVRGKQELTIKELSKKAGIGRNTLSRIENGKNKPNLCTIGKLAKALNIDIQELVL